jgi:hypothetical protein
MQNAIRNYWQSALVLVAFLALLGIIGGQEMRWHMERDLESRMQTIRDERSGFRNWEVTR